MPTTMLEETTFDEVEKVRDELSQQLKVKNVTKDRVIVEFLAVYRESHPEPHTLDPGKTTTERTKIKRTKKHAPGFEVATAEGKIKGTTERVVSQL